MNFWTFFSTLGLVLIALVILTALADYIRCERALKRAMLVGAAVLCLANCAAPQDHSTITKPSAAPAVCAVAETLPDTVLQYGETSCTGFGHVIVVNEKCGALVAPKAVRAEDDGCIRFRNGNDWGIYKLSTWVPGTPGGYQPVD